MQDVLVEEWRRRHAKKRGGGRSRADLLEFGADDDSIRADVLDLRDALTELAVHDPAGARLINLRFFAGRTLEEAAEIVGCTFATARRDWEYARAWLRERLSGSST
jgi:RNA polymerase sigma factor (TIGR02999 family)